MIELLQMDYAIEGEFVSTMLMAIFWLDRGKLLLEIEKNLILPDASASIVALPFCLKDIFY